MNILHAIHTACGIETRHKLNLRIEIDLLHAIHTACGIETISLASWMLSPLPNCMQSIPLAVLKLAPHALRDEDDLLHAIHTACGIETLSSIVNVTSTELLHAIHTACGVAAQKAAARFARLLFRAANYRSHQSLWLHGLFRGKMVY